MASAAIHMDRWWNPSLTEQATGIPPSPVFEHNCSSLDELRLLYHGMLHRGGSQRHRRPQQLHVGLRRKGGGGQMGGATVEARSGAWDNKKTLGL